MAPMLRPRVQRVGCLCYKRVPAAPKATAAARPMPLVPPTTTATLFSKDSFTARSTYPPPPG
jgi:hypothetical protein